MLVENHTNRVLAASLLLARSTLTAFGKDTSMLVQCNVQYAGILAYIDIPDLAGSQYNSDVLSICLVGP